MALELAVSPALRRLSLPFEGPLDLEATLYSGQAFRWARQPDGSHRGFVRNRACRVRMHGSTLHVDADDPIPSHALSQYFRLDGSHAQFLAETPTDPAFEAARERFRGLRLLRQDPWEMLVSFVVSQNSNEAKIRGTIERLCRLAGQPTARGPDPSHGFPTPQALAQLSDAKLRSTGMGYRARFVHAVAQAVADGDFDPHALATMRYEDAFDRLMELDGVGAKVADCVLLYGCDHQLAFPSDVWVRRFLRETYLRRRKHPNHLRIREFAWKHFGPHAGYAQHLLFHYRRTVGKLATSRP